MIDYRSYACPRTNDPLRYSEESLVTDDGLNKFPIRDGIPVFLRFPAIEDDDANAQLRELNQLAVTAGWRAAIDNVYGQGSGMMQYVTDSKRASFIDLLPLSSESAVLEIGPGLGQFTGILARQVASVAALEVVPGQAAFVAERCKQDGLTNVNVAIGGDDCRLPYPDDSFDVVVLNLVFEWCASRCIDESHEAVQSRLLSQIRRVLKPGGALYLTTKNRFSLHYLIGKRDEHLFEMPFGSALPRWLSRSVLKLKGRGRAPGSLHSYNALRAMLRVAGFDPVKSFWAAPEMRSPAKIVPTDLTSIRRARQDTSLLQAQHRSTRVLMKMVPDAMVKHLAQGLVFLATRQR